MRRKCDAAAVGNVTAPEGACAGDACCAADNMPPEAAAVDACARVGTYDCDASALLGNCTGAVRVEPGACTPAGAWQPGTTLRLYLPQASERVGQIL